MTYDRKDGVKLSATVYLPPDYKPGTRLPFILWAYPAEFTDAASASQVVGSPNRFTTINGASHLLFLTQGYGVMDNPTMPIVGPGETANDTYVEQLMASAEAADRQDRGHGRGRPRPDRRRPGTATARS